MQGFRDHLDAHSKQPLDKFTSSLYGREVIEKQNVIKGYATLIGMCFIHKPQSHL